MIRMPTALHHEATFMRTLVPLAFLATTACAHYIGGNADEPCGMGPTLQATSATSLSACAQAVAGDADTRHGAGDEQRLAVAGPGGQLQYGPKATITPLRGYFGMKSVTHATAQEMARGVPLALITSDSAYPKLGLRAGKNVLIVAVPQGSDSGTALMVPLDGSVATPLAVHVTDHMDKSDYPLPTARWIWSDKDETMWVACGRRCCWVVPVLN
jgi:hypothetical protein